LADFVRIPVVLMLDPRLTVHDKLVWMVMRLDRLDSAIPEDDRYSPTRLGRRTGLPRSTIYNAKKRLEATGWFTSRNAEGKPEAIVNYDLTKPRNIWVTMPAELLLSDLEPRDIVTYGVLKDNDYCRRQQEKFTYRSLADYMGRCAKTVRRAIQALVQGSWMTTSQERKSRKAPYKYDLDTPSNRYCREQIELTRNRIKRGNGKGEAIAAAMVKLVLEPSECLANARPDWLTNPETHEPLELDLWFPVYKLGVEFNGPQHYQPTSFATIEDVMEQQQRDALKAEIMQKLGFNLVVLTAADLSIKAVIQKLQGLAPLRPNLRWYRSLIQYLNDVGMDYRQKGGCPV